MSRIHPDRRLAAGLLVGLVSVGGIGVSGQQPSESIPIPPILIDESWVDARRAAQLATTGEFEVFYDFRFGPGR